VKDKLEAEPMSRGTRTRRGCGEPDPPESGGREIDSAHATGYCAVMGKRERQTAAGALRAPRSPIPLRMRRGTARLVLLGAVAAALGLSALQGCTSPDEPDQFDWTGLLTDEELVTEEDPEAPEEDSLWAAWVYENNIPIRSLEAGNFSDLLALRPFFEGARLVQLGENGHGVSEFDKVKTRLIKFLHEEMGFNVIAFESSFYECLLANDRVASLDAEELLNRSLAEVWRCREVLDLFEYIKQRRSVGAPIRIAGIDIRISSPTIAETRPEFLREILAAADSVFAQHVYALDAETVERRWDRDYFLEHADSLTGEYGEVESFIEANRDTIERAFPDRPEVVGIAAQVVKTVLTYIEHMRYDAEGREDEAFEARDKGMAANVEFLLDELYPGEKIIVWAHNAHVCYDYSSIPERGLLNMGGRLAPAHKAETYTVGLYMYRGEAGNNDRSVDEVPRSESGSLESILYRTRRKHCLIEMLSQSRTEGNSWMFESIKASEWGRGTIALVPRDQYDAILFVDTVSPPDYDGE